ASAVGSRRGKLARREDTWRLPDGSERVYAVLEAGVGVAVLAFADDEHVVLVRQYRHLQRGVSWELPGGGARPGEDPAVTAQRELREESGAGIAPAGWSSSRASIPPTRTSTRPPTATSPASSWPIRSRPTTTSSSSARWCRSVKRCGWR